MTIPTPHRRDLLPDVLRGFALLGIVLVNLSFFSHNTAEGIRGVDVLGWGNSVATVIMVTLFQGKFYLLFSFLFGYSSHYITRGRPAGRGRFARRSIVLIVFGALHFTLLWHGDILFVYGVLGLILILLMFRTEKTLKAWAWVLWGVSALLLVSVSLLTLLAEVNRVDLGQSPDRLNRVMDGGTFFEAIGPRLEMWLLALSGGVLLQGGLVFAAFIVGVLAARKGLLGENSSQLRTGSMMRWGFGLGLPLQFLAAMIYVPNEVSTGTSEAVYLGALTLGFMTAPLLSMGFLGAIVVLIRHRPRLVEWMKYPGKASLTNYILQSLLLSVVFGPWGFGLFQSIDYWVALLIGLAIYAVLSLLSAWWLMRFSQGPLEKLMGVLTARSRSTKD